jgi:hypothetical protein
MLALCAAIACVAALPVAASAKVAIGISDSGAAMFENPLFTDIPIKNARLVVSWDVAVNKKRKKELAADVTWLNDAKQDGVTPLISFSGNGNYIPKVSQYTTAVKAFVKKFPSVKQYTAWNEPDWVYRPPLAKHPLLAASYYNALVKNCKHCTVLAGDVYLPAKQLATWVKAYKKGLKGRIAGWALHNYYDVRTHKTTQLTTLEKLTTGPIWLDEISGVERRGHWQYKNQSVAAAGRDEQFLFSLPRKFKRVTHIYHYEWQAVPSQGWDSGLLGPDGTPRAAYNTLKAAIG